MTRCEWESGRNDSMPVTAARRGDGDPSCITASIKLLRESVNQGVPKSDLGLVTLQGRACSYTLTSRVFVPVGWGMQKGLGNYHYIHLCSRNTKEYKERTDSNSPTRPNKVVGVATLLL